MAEAQHGIIANPRLSLGKVMASLGNPEGVEELGRQESEERRTKVSATVTERNYTEGIHRLSLSSSIGHRQEQPARPHARKRRVKVAKKRKRTSKRYCC